MISLMGGNPSGSSSCTTPLDSFNNGLIFSRISAGRVTFSLTTKANFYFVSFDSTKNLSRLHMDMNNFFFCRLLNRWSWYHDNSFTLPSEHIDVPFISVGSTNIVLLCSPQKNITCVHINHITCNRILIKLTN